MTSSSQSRPPLQPTLKASSTAQSSQVTTVAAQTAQSSRPSSRTRSSRTRQDPTQSDFLSEKATISLIRRVLVAENSHGLDSRSAYQPIDDVLPPLTSSNEVDVQLYAIVAVVIKDSVNSWYAKITQDQTFVDEVIQIIAHCSRAIEQRVRRLDFVKLILDDAAIILEQHIHAYRTSVDCLAGSPYHKEPWEIYSTLSPHPALDPTISIVSQQEKESTYRQLLVQGALAVLLPTEDVQNACLRTLVCDIIADLILGRAFGERICEGWFMHETISKAAVFITTLSDSGKSSKGSNVDNRSRLEKFGLLGSKSSDSESHSPKQRQSILGYWFWRVLQCGYIAYILLKFIIVGILQARLLPPKARNTHKAVESSSSTYPLETKQRSSVLVDQRPRAILSYRIFSALSTLLDVSVRMPWLVGAFSSWQYLSTSVVGRLGGSNSLLDKFLYNSLQKHVFNSSLAPRILVNLRAAIFPGNSIGAAAAPPPPNEEETRQIRRRAAEDLLSLFPTLIPRTFYATDDHLEIVQQVEEDILDVFGDKNMNKHLLYNILELVLVRIVPELAEQTPTELLAERGVLLDPDEDLLL